MQRARVKRGGEDTVIVTLVCTTEQAKEVISGAFTGDFSMGYRAQVRMTLILLRKACRPIWA